MVMDAGVIRQWTLRTDGTAVISAEMPIEALRQFVVEKYIEYQKGHVTCSLTKDVCDT